MDMADNDITLEKVFRNREQTIAYMRPLPPQKGVTECLFLIKSAWLSCFGPWSLRGDGRPRTGKVTGAKDAIFLDIFAY